MNNRFIEEMNFYWILANILFIMLLVGLYFETIKIGYSFIYFYFEIIMLILFNIGFYFFNKLKKQIKELKGKEKKDCPLQYYKPPSKEEL